MFFIYFMPFVFAYGSLFSSLFMSNSLSKIIDLIMSYSSSSEHFKFAKTYACMVKANQTYYIYG